MGLESLLASQIIGLAEAVDDEVATLLVAGTGITLTYNDGANTLTIANTGLGGSTGSTDNRILRADGTAGSNVQNSAVTIDDSGNISGLGTVGCGNVTIGSGSGGSLTFNNAAGSPSIANLSNAGIRVNTGAGARGVVEFNIAQLEGTGYVYWLLRGILASSANGVVHVHNFNLDDSTANQVLVLGPGTSASNGVRLKRAMGSTTLQVRNGDDSAAGALDCGAITASGVVEVPAGTSSAPGLKVGSSSQTGLHWSTNQLHFIVNGSSRAWVDANSVMQLNFAQLNGVGSYIGFHGGAFLYSGLSNTLEQYNGGSLTSAQTYRLYNTRPSSTNFEAFQTQWASNEARIGTAVGSAGGTQRNTVLGAWNSSNTWTAGLTIGTTGNVIASALFFAGVYTVATLPSAAANAGALAQVTDSSVTTNGSAVSGGGSNRVVVYSNGSTWDVVVA